MGAISGDVNTNPMLCVSAADLASRPIGTKDDGDFAYIPAFVGTIQGPYFFLRRGSAEAPGVGVVTVAGAQWLSLALFGDLGGAVPPFTHEFFVDAGTTNTSPDGSVGMPFKFIMDAFAHVFNNSLGRATIYITAGFYDEKLDFSALIGVDVVVPDITFMGAGRDTTIIKNLSLPGGTLVWTVDSGVTAGSWTFQDLSILGSAVGAKDSIAIDAQANPSFMDGQGLVFRNVRSDTFRTISNCVVLTLEDCDFTAAASDITDPVFRNNAQMTWVDSTFRIPTGGAADLVWDPLNFPIPTATLPDWRFVGSTTQAVDLIGSAQLYIRGCPHIIADAGCTFVNSVLFRPIVDTDGNQMVVNARSQFSLVDVNYTVDPSGIFPEFNFSQSYFVEFDYLADFNGGEPAHAYVYLCNTFFPTDGLITMDGAVTLDMRGATFTQSTIVYNAPSKGIIAQQFTLTNVNTTPRTVNFVIPFTDAHDYVPNLIPTNAAGAAAMAAGYSVVPGSGSLAITFAGGAPANANFLLGLEPREGTFFIG